VLEKIDEIVVISDTGVVETVGNFSQFKDLKMFELFDLKFQLNDDTDKDINVSVSS
jgi:hypothetical protein